MWRVLFCLKIYKNIKWRECDESCDECDVLIFRCKGIFGGKKHLKFLHISSHLLWECSWKFHAGLFWVKKVFACRPPIFLVFSSKSLIAFVEQDKTKFARSFFPAFFCSSAIAKKKGSPGKEIPWKMMRSYRIDPCVLHPISNLFGGFSAFGQRE